jgi:hypothetical protein
MSETVEIIIQAAEQAGMDPLHFAAQLIQRAYKIEMDQSCQLHFIPNNSEAMAFLAGAAAAGGGGLCPPREGTQGYLEDGVGVVEFGGPYHYPDGTRKHKEKDRIW